LGGRAHRREYIGRGRGRREGAKVTQYLRTNDYKGGSGVFKRWIRCIRCVHLMMATGRTWRSEEEGVDGKCDFSQLMVDIGYSSVSGA
jgi:hypothetical protein